jgi:hypothetical protein
MFLGMACIPADSRFFTSYQAMPPVGTTVFLVAATTLKQLLDLLVGHAFAEGNRVSELVEDVTEESNRTVTGRST